MFCVAIKKKTVLFMNKCQYLPIFIKDVFYIIYPVKCKYISNRLCISLLLLFFDFESQFPYQFQCTYSSISVVVLFLFR